LMAAVSHFCSSVLRNGDAGLSSSAACASRPPLGECSCAVCVVAGGARASCGPRTHLQIPVHLDGEAQRAPAQVHHAALQRAAVVRPAHQQRHHLRQVALDTRLRQRVDAVTDVVLHPCGLGRVQVPARQPAHGRQQPAEGRATPGGNPTARLPTAPAPPISRLWRVWDPLPGPASALPYPPPPPELHAPHEPLRRWSGCATAGDSVRVNGLRLPRPASARPVLPCIAVAVGAAHPFGYRRWLCGGRSVSRAPATRGGTGRDMSRRGYQPQSSGGLPAPGRKSYLRVSANGVGH
jgi:hypothetical protein